MPRGLGVNLQINRTLPGVRSATNAALGRHNSALPEEWIKVPWKQRVVDGVPPE